MAMPMVSYNVPSQIHDHLVVEMLIMTWYESHTIVLEIHVVTHQGIQV